MQCRKVIRTQSFGNNKNLVQSEIIIGINDYIPPELKKRNKLDILIEGDITIAIFRLLWNEYYCKTLLKEMWMAYLGESPQDLPCENKKTSGMFAKIGSNIYNLSQIIDINPVACKAQENIAESLQLTLEAFAPNGSTKKYSITISEGHAKKEYDVILKIIKNCQGKEGQPLSRNSNSANTKKKVTSDLLKGKESTTKKNGKQNMRKMTELDIEHPTICLSRNSKDNSLYNNDFICANSKLNIMKMRQSSAKKGLISQTNSKKRIISQSNSKRINYQSECKSMPNQQLDQIKRESNLFRAPVLNYKDSLIMGQTNIRERERILSQILTGKEEQTIHLRRDLELQQQRFENTLGAMEQQHNQEVEKIKNDVKEILEGYSMDNQEYAKQNEWLKKQLENIENTLKKKQIQWEYTKEQNALLREKVGSLDSRIQSLEKTNATLGQQLHNKEQSSASNQLQLMQQLQVTTSQLKQYKQKYEKLMNKVRDIMDTD